MTGASVGSAPAARVTPARRGPARVSAVTLAVALLLAAAVVAGLAVGARAIPPGEVLEALTGGADPVVRGIVLDQRLPRTVIAVVVGASLAVSGSLMQALTRNPLAEPGILGVNAGAALAVVVGALVLGVQRTEVQLWGAFAGAAAAAVGVYVLAGSGRGGPAPLRLTLAGVAVTAALAALTHVLVLGDPQVFDEFRVWVNGSTQNRWFSHLRPVLPFVVVGALAAVLATPGLDALALGEQTGRALGVPLGWVRGLTVVAVTLLAGSATALVGPISFLGLAAPFVARRLAGSDLRRHLVVAALLGAAILVLADVVARVATAAEAPVGTVVTVAGAPLFVAFVRRRGMPRL